MACVKFGISEADGEPLLHDVLLSFLTAAMRIESPRAWLVAAMCNASRAYWREQRRAAAAEPVTIEEIAELSGPFDVETLQRELLVRAILQKLRPRDRLVLRLHYYERLTVEEIAAQFHTTAAYAGRLVSKALRRARAELRRKAAPERER